MATKRDAGINLRILSAVGIFSAAVIAVCANVLVHRFYERWDLTSSGLYTLSQATLETLHSLEEPVEVVVFLSASDPLSLSVQHMLSAYSAETTKIVPRFVDPDRSPAEFLAMQNQYGIVAGKTEDGRIVTDASIVIARGDKHWFVTTDDMVVYDEKDDQARPALEQALTEGIRNVLGKEKTVVCFTRGHQEISADDGGPQGMAELKFRIQKDNYVTKNVDLNSPAKDQSLGDCRVVVIAGPELPFTPSAVDRLMDYFRRDGALLLLVNPMLDESNRIRPTGLERLTALAGVQFNNDFVIEGDDELRLPAGLGETFFVKPVEHAITAGLTDGDVPRFLPRVTISQSVDVLPKSGAKALLETSAKAFSVQDIRPFIEEGRAVEPRAGDRKGPLKLAVAIDKSSPGNANADVRRGSRMVVAGSASLVFGQSWRDATLIGNRLFVESALSWLAAQPSVVSVPEKPSHAAGMSLTEDTMTDVQLYVLVYMPVSALLLGGLILYRRRTTEKRSRRGSVANKPGAAS